jgi:hypothetical protein
VRIRFINYILKRMLRNLTAYKQMLRAGKKEEYGLLNSARRMMSESHEG